MSRDERADRLAQVQSQVAYHRERLALYRRLHGSRPCERLRDLENAYVSAQDRLIALHNQNTWSERVVDTLPSPDDHRARRPRRWDGDRESTRQGRP